MKKNWTRRLRETLCPILFFVVGWLLLSILCYCFGFLQLFYFLLAVLKHFAVLLQ